MKQINYLILILLFFVSCKQDKSTNSENKITVDEYDSKEFKSNKPEFVIEYPANWEIYNEPNNINKDCYFCATELLDNPDDEFRENILVLVSDLNESEKNLIPKDLYIKLLEEIKKIGISPFVEEVTDNYFYFIYNSVNKNLKYRTYTLGVKKGDKINYVHLTTELKKKSEDNEEDINEKKNPQKDYIKVFARIIESFK